MKKKKGKEYQDEQQPPPVEFGLLATESDPEDEEGEDNDEDAEEEGEEEGDDGEEASCEGIKRTTSFRRAEAEGEMAGPKVDPKN